MRGHYNLILALVCLASAIWYGVIDDGTNRNALLVVFAIFVIRHHLDLAVERIESRLRVVEHLTTLRGGREQ